MRYPDVLFRYRRNAMKTNDKPAPTRKNAPTHSEDGVDLTLIRWMLSLTPAQRLQVLQQHVRSVEELRARNRQN